MSPVVVCLGDLVEDVVVHPEGSLREGTDTAARIERRRGGSAANVAVAVAAAGGRARFVGCVGADPLGDRLVADLSAAGVEVCVQRQGRTGSVIAVLDRYGERSFFTDRGAAVQMSALPTGWDRDMGALHVPLYSLDGEPLAGIARSAAAGRGAALLSVDASSVAVIERLGVDVVRCLGADLLLANAAEAAALGPLERLAPLARTVVVKHGPDPAVVLWGGETIEVPSAHRLAAVDDTVGAGDAFAAGVLVALVVGASPLDAVEQGHRCAAAHLSRGSIQAAGAESSARPSGRHQSGENLR